MPTQEQKAVIVGAGLVGSLWAIFLARRGYDVHVYERRSDMRKAGYVGGRSINLAISHRAFEAMRRAGILEKVHHTAIAMPGRMMHAVSGDLTFQPYGKSGQAIYSVSRGGLNLELLRIAGGFPNVHFYFDHRCLNVDLNSPIAEFLDEKTGERHTVAAPLIFGTDGAYSAVRYAMQRTDRFNYRQQHIEHGYKELCIPPTAEGGFRMEKSALHIWPRGNFMLIALPNADGSFTCTLFLPFESASGPSFADLKNDDDVRGFFLKYFPDAVPLMPTLLADFWANPTSSLMTVSCSPWQWQNRMLLLGDAAHAIVPFYGQGMNAGFEDCAILDAMLDEQGGDWAKTIADFAQKRVSDGDAILELALRNFIEMRDLVGDPRFLLRKKMAAHLHEKHPDRFLPVYSMVSFSSTPYHLALQEDERQNEMFRRMLALPGIEENWADNPQVEAIFREYYP